MQNIMALLNEEYRAHIDRLVGEHPLDEAMHLAVGGNWEAIGAVEEAVLRAAGLRPDTDLLDVGCGSGRLAVRLARSGFQGRYLGLDVVPLLLDYARTQAPEFEFAETLGLTAPTDAGAFDMVSFFSVFTHIPFEAHYRWLLECRRVLRPHGRVVVTFLEFVDPRHWPIFQTCAETIGVARHHNQFVHRQDLTFMADRAGFDLVSVTAGSDHVLKLDGVYERDNGEPVVTPARMGQSWMILQRR
ncbi:class I SAM-dependent methyltransferase [Nakamurella silvestris]|nr:class I SAM-dependent methyltransferase [Nakamurella silvestris]